MTGTPMVKARNDPLTAAAPATSTKPSVSNHRRSLSCAPSARSRASRVTIMESDPDSAAYIPSKLDEDEHVTHHTRSNTWVDRIFGAICLKRKESSMEKQPSKSKTPEWPEHMSDSSTWPSPWILPVYVVSNELDEDKHPKTQIAKCTIDTGNLQGNIVSRSFVATLGYLESDFDKLTKEEARGGTGITGDEHIPLGAIYLTWYHNNSPKVFRDMRFLVSPTEHFELIIGARSIYRDNILNVPCLPTLPKNITEQDPELKALKNLKHKYTTLVQEKDGDIQVIDNDRSLPRDNLPTLHTEYEESKFILKFYKLMYKVYDGTGTDKVKEAEATATAWNSILNVYKNKLSKDNEKKIREELEKETKDKVWDEFWQELEKEGGHVESVDDVKSVG